jgi:tetrapyrrole methylase family protein/MazG family protein
MNGCNFIEDRSGMNRPENFHELVQLMQRLRAKNGCPWDRKQTHKSLRPFLLEETHEVLEAIESRDPKKLKDELGDLLFQVIFHAQLAAEKKQYDIYDVIAGSVEKMRRRHPHIFGGTTLRTSRQVLENWEEIKKRERGGSGHSLLAGVPRTLPALIRAHRVMAKAARVGFTWSRMDEAVAKVNEEMAELEEALVSRRSARITEELGDAMFALVNLARFAGANPEDALHLAVGKFIRRFAHLEKTAQRQQKELSQYSLEALTALWEEAKRPGRRFAGRRTRLKGKKKLRAKGKRPFHRLL